MVEIHLASRNAKKLEEMQRILDEHLPGIRVVGLDDVPAYDEPVEDEPTFTGNALMKARAGAAATGLPTLADDSGLCVDALNGMPGVLSARWSGPPKSDRRNNELLLAQLVRRARRAPRRALRLRGGVRATPTAASWSVEGRMHGRVIRELRGERRLRLRRGVRGRRPPGRDHRRARRSPTRTRSPTAAGRCARSRLRWPRC